LHNQLLSIILGNPVPDLLKEVARNILRPYLAVDCMFARPYIGFSSADETWSLDNLPNNVQSEKDWNSNVRNEEVLNLEATNEGCEPVENDNNREVDEGEPSSEWLAYRFEDERVTVDILSYECRTESKIRNANGNPSEKLGDCRDIYEPSEHGLRTVSNDQVREKGNRSCECNTVNRNTFLRTL